MRVAVIRANGQLGADVCRELHREGHETLALTHSGIEIAEIDSVFLALAEARPDLVVNTAAMHHVERCEEEPEQAYRVNALGARNLALWSREVDIPLMHVSTDYVFDGGKQSPYGEDDLPVPLNVYGNTKLAGELFIRSIADRYFILRTSGLYGKSPCRAKGANFVDKMLELARERDELRVVDGEVLTPTSTLAVARQIVELVGTDCYGLLHATAEGSCSWYEFAREIFRIAGVRVNLQPAAPGEFPAKVPRPTYSVLSNRRLTQARLNTFTDWRQALQTYLVPQPAAV